MTGVPKPKYKRTKPKKKRKREMQEACVQRDGRCRWCGRIDDTLVGHHIRSFGATGIDELSNMITLCGYCHGCEGNGYLDWRRCNVPVLIRARPGMVGVNAKSDNSWKAFECNDLLTQILEGGL